VPQAVAFPLRPPGRRDQGRRRPPSGSWGGGSACRGSSTSTTPPARRAASPGSTASWRPRAARRPELGVLAMPCGGV